MKKGAGSIKAEAGCRNGQPGIEKRDRRQVVDLADVCRLLGCSGTDPELCQTKQSECAIIRKVIRYRPDIVYCMKPKPEGGQKSLFD